MIVQCNQCSKRYKISPKTFTCTGCGATIAVDPLYGMSPSQTHRLNDDNTFATAQAHRSIKWLHKFQTKMSMILTVTTIIIMAGYIGYIYESTKSRMSEELGDMAEITAIRLSKSLMVSLWEVDRKHVKETLKSEMQEKRIFSILVKDDDLKTIFEGVKRDPDWKIISTRNDSLKGLIENTKAITRGKDVIGMVQVAVSDRFMWAEAKNYALKAAITTLILTISILITMMVALKILLIQPLGKMTSAANQMSLGDLNVLIDIKSRDEIGVLAEALQRMQTSLAMALKRLKR